jgi:membrane associated rhomboid family serine protease
VGIYDRDYYRQPRRSGFSSHLPRTVVGTLIAINVAVWLADLFTSTRYNTPDGPVIVHWLSNVFGVHVGKPFLGGLWWEPLAADTLKHPWLWWQFLTAGFTHDPNGIWHILGNMFALFVFGRDIEARYGSREFLRVYLATLLFANFAWCIVTEFAGRTEWATCYGASGAIAGVVVLYAFNFPHTTFLLFFVFPIPAWLLGAGIVIYGMYGAMVGIRGSNVAYVAHVAGAAFALLYYQGGWNLTRLTGGLPGGFKSPFRRKPRLRVRSADDEPPHPDFSAEVDRILEKIYREGEAGLTPKERQTLEQASREYQRKGAANSGRGNPPKNGS